MSFSDFVSVTIVTYNSGRFIKRCLDSVLDQKYPQMEIIVIDNASDDGTIDLLEPFEDRCRIIYNQENIGFAGAQNQAIALSRAPVLAQSVTVSVTANGATTPWAEIDDLTSAGPEVRYISTPISLAMMWARVVLPRPGGPLKRM